MSERSNGTEYLYNRRIAEEKRRRKKAELEIAALSAENTELKEQIAEIEKHNAIIKETVLQAVRAAVLASIGFAVLAVLRKRKGV